MLVIVLVVILLVKFIWQIIAVFAFKFKLVLKEGGSGVSIVEELENSSLLGSIFGNAPMR